AARQRALPRRDAAHGCGTHLRRGVEGAARGAAARSTPVDRCRRRRPPHWSTDPAPATDLLMAPVDMQIPELLIHQILSGHCIAFIGAGFAMPAVPTWRNLREQAGHTMAARYPAASNIVDTLGDDPDNTELEMVAQQLQSLGREAFL